MIRHKTSATMPGHLIRRLHQMSGQLFSQKVQQAGFDLTPVQFAALSALSHHDGIDQATLAHSIAKDRATTGAVIERLNQKGLVKRLIGQRDKRAREVYISDKGRALLETLFPVVSGLQQDILQGLTTEEYDQFINLAQKVVEASKA